MWDPVCIVLSEPHTGQIVSKSSICINILSHFSSIISSDQIEEYLAQSFPRQWSGKWLQCLLGHHLFRLWKKKQSSICSDLGMLLTNFHGFFALIFFSFEIDPFWYSWHRKIIIPPVLQHIKNWNSTSPCWKDILSMCKALHHHLIFVNLALWKAKQADTYWSPPLSHLSYCRVHLQESLLKKLAIFTYKIHLLKSRAQDF